MTEYSYSFTKEAVSVAGIWRMEMIKAGVERILRNPVQMGSKKTGRHQESLGPRTKRCSKSIG